jgi:hypothetical protein
MTDQRLAGVEKRLELAETNLEHEKVAGKQDRTDIDALQKRVEFVEKRAEDVRWVVATITGLLTFIVGGSALWYGINLRGDEDKLQRFEEQIRDQFKIHTPPNLQLSSAPGVALEGREIHTRVVKTPGQPGQRQFRIDLFIRNSTEGGSGPINIKLYTSEGLKLRLTSDDEPEFKYEDVIDSKSIPELPGHFSEDLPLYINLPETSTPGTKRYPAYIKIFYANESPAIASFSLVVDSVEHY